MSSYTREQLEKWLKTINVKGNVIDVGGSQLSIKKRVNSWKASSYKVLDLPYFDLNYKPIIDIDWKKADIVFCIEVSEYIFDPIQALKNLKRLLKKGGILYMSFHFIYPIHKPAGMDYLRYTPDGIKMLLEETGFEIIDCINRVSENIDLEKVFIAEKMHTMNTNNNIIGTLIKAKI